MARTLWILMLIASGAALACPDCPTAQQVQASVLDHRFWLHLFLISLPLLVLGAITGLLYRVGQETR